ncbi:MAG: acyl carrier protein [Candidatus Latescibacteria bacterium]|nr:acyl carrier protein [Candidatus Latescibacterota bacterium]
MNPPAALDERPIARRVKQMVVRSLGLAIEPEELGEDEVLYGSGLGADSVATLEVVFALETEFGIEVADDELRVELFATVQSLVDYVAQKLRVR